MTEDRALNATRNSNSNIKSESNSNNNSNNSNNNKKNNRNRKHGRGGRGRGNGTGTGGRSGDGGRGNSNTTTNHESKKVRMNAPDVKMEDATSNGPGPNTNFQSRTSSTTRSQLTTEAFASLPINSSVKQAIQETLQYEFMTKVQAQTLPTTLSGTNVIAKAKTGTGKTISFLLPAIETALKSPHKKTSALIISPTRELAQQIEEEAISLLSKLPQSQRLTTASFVGGIKITQDFKKLRQRGGIDILVATPGRMIDHLENQGLDLSQLDTLIFDEADQLLDMGFRPSIERILRSLPRKSRQVLLFSATLPKSVEEIASLALGEIGGGKSSKPDMTLIDTVGEEESTHKHIPQYVQHITLENGISQLYRLLDQHLKQVPRDYKGM